jgi:hypothetical protein
MAKDKQKRGSKTSAVRARTKTRAAVGELAAQKTAARKVVVKKTVAKKAVVKKTARRRTAAKKTMAKKTAVKAVAKKAGTKKAVAKKIVARKSVPIKTARVSKRALLPPLPPPPTAPLKAARSAARHPSRAKAASRAKITKTGRAVFEIPACTEAVLRQKLRLAAPYVELWLAQKENVLTEADGLTPEAAFVRLWQWLMLEVRLDGGQIMITPDLIEKLFTEEMGRAPPV